MNDTRIIDRSTTAGLPTGTARIRWTDSPIDRSYQKHSCLVMAAPERGEEAMRLARELGIPLLEATDPRVKEYATMMWVQPERIELRTNVVKGSSPIFVDFVGGAFGYRRRTSSGARQPLAKAVGVRRGFRPSVFDACAGLGRDGFMLAAIGCQVTMVERSPLVAALLYDGLQRASRSEAAGVITERIELVIGDAREVMRNLVPSQHPDVVFLDPMYSERNGSALVKKEMRIFRELVGEDADAGELLAAGLVCARERVVVKRARALEALGKREPDFVIAGSRVRFDVYKHPPQK